MNSVHSTLDRGTVASRSRSKRSRSLLARFAALMLLGLLSVAVPSLARTVITVDVGRPSKGCSGFGICKITIDFASERSVPAAVDIEGNRMWLQFMQQPRDRGDLLTVEEDIVLDRATSLKLGYQQVTIKKGEYSVDYSSNQNGMVGVDVQTQGIVITVNIGRASRNCTGFGICSIVIGASSAERAVPGVGTLNGNTLDLDLLDTPADHGNVLTIDEDLELDPAVARAFGAQRLVIKKGEYPVDYSTNPNGHVVLPTMRIGIGVTVTIGRASRDCAGFGVCKVRIDFDLRLKNDAPATASVSNGTLSLDLLKPAGEQGSVLPIDEDIVLDSATSLALGYKQVVVKKGMYPVDYSANPNGHVDVDVATRGIIIKVEVGRRSVGCTKFGICSITVGVDFSERSVPTSTTLEGDVLDIDFLDITPDRGDVLPIDEDIVLDGATSRALGYQQVVVKKGEYPVDYSTNPNGRVRVKVSPAGIGITVKVARPSGGCERGFGICIIIRDWLSAERNVPATASLHDDMFSLDFLGQTPEQGDVLVLEEDVVLDEATSRQFGYQQLTLRKGEYPVDYSKNPFGHVEIPAAKIGIGVTITIGRASRDCGGFGVCKISVDFDLSLKNNVPGVVSIKDGKLVIDLLKQSETQEDMLPIDQDIALDPATARALGYKNITLKRGVYQVDYSKNPNGHVEVDIETRGITVTLYTGRASRDCTGFGICKIVIAFSERNGVPGVISLEDGMLDVQFMKMPEMHGDTLVIDEDIVLDEETAQALGVPNLTLKRGSYVVDYSENPNGTLRVVTSTSGAASVQTLSTVGNASFSLVAVPNPVVGNTTFSFTLPTSERVTVTLTDTRGTQVARLLNDEMRSAGQHTLNFDASSLPAGTYFYTVQAGGVAEMHRVQVVK